MGWVGEAQPKLSLRGGRKANEATSSRLRLVPSEIASQPVLGPACGRTRALAMTATEII